MRVTKQAIILGIAVTAVKAWPCDLTGAWYDNSGSLATIIQNASGSLLATAVSPVSWQTALGALTGNGTSLELIFNGNTPLTAAISPTCWTLRFANMEQWQRGQAFEDIVGAASMHGTRVRGIVYRNTFADNGTSGLCRAS
jgi:hypothetical protein